MASATTSRKSPSKSGGPSRAKPLQSTGFLRNALTLLCTFAVAAAVLILLTQDILHYDQWHVDKLVNPSMLEGLSWLHGRLDIPLRGGDTASVDGKTYNVFPPLFSVISSLVIAIVHAATGKNSFPGWLYTVLLLGPLIASAFWAFLTCTGSPWKAVVMVVMLIAGTALLPQMVACQRGWIWQTNQVLSQVGLLLIAGDCLGKKRLWPSLLGLLICAWTRQLTVLLAAPILLILARRKAQWLCAGLTIAMILAVPMMLSDLKFGSPFDSGYARIYAGRSDPPAQRAAHGLFAARFIPENFYYMNLCPPVIWQGGSLHIEPNDWGNSIWIGTPILLYVFIAFNQWWREPARRILLLGVVPVVLMILMYHTTGWVQAGHYRFSLDFLPIVLAVVAPYVWGRWRTPLTIAMLAWSVIYFRWTAQLFAGSVFQ